VSLSGADVGGDRRVRLRGKTKQIFLRGSIDVSKVLKLHMTQVLSVN
jgi:hypothetical protein